MQRDQKHLTHNDVHTYTSSTVAVKQPTFTELNTHDLHIHRMNNSHGHCTGRETVRERDMQREREDTLIDISSLKSL